MKLAICTLTVGEFFEKLAHESHPTLKAYAERCGADFHVFRELTPGRSIPGYQKMTIMQGLLLAYDRVLFVDTDILVRHDAPNIFDLVPLDSVAAFDEGEIYPERVNAKACFCDQTGVKDETWLKSKSYYNTGVLLASKQHLSIFAEPIDEPYNFAEQTMLNWRFHFDKVKMFRLPHRFNRLLGTLLRTGEPLDDSYLVHFAGAFLDGPTAAGNYEAWLACADRFKKYQTEGVPLFRRRIYIESATALGDTVSTEPVVRYIREVLEPDADITIKTLFPEVFAHLAEYPLTTVLGPKDTRPDLGHLRIALFPEIPPTNYNLMHSVDYASMCAFHGAVPDDHRGIQLAVTVPPLKPPAGELGDYILVHPGRSWQSKTFPVDWWNAVISGLTKYVAVGLIGRTYPDDDFRGTVDVNAKGTWDIRNKTSLSQLIATISGASALVSNDSSPVHIAGAFTTPVVMVTSAKHPDFIWPKRDARLNKTLGRAIGASKARIGIVNSVFMHQCEPDELLASLPDPADVVRAALKAFTRYSPTTVRRRSLAPAPRALLGGP